MTYLLENLEKRDGYALTKKETEEKSTVSQCSVHCIFDTNSLIYRCEEPMSCESMWLSFSFHLSHYCIS